MFTGMGRASPGYYERRRQAIGGYKITYDWAKNGYVEKSPGVWVLPGHYERWIASKSQHGNFGRKKRSSAVFNNMDGTTIGTQVAERAIFNNPKKGKNKKHKKTSKILIFLTLLGVCRL